jgi:hypothetical protein
MNLTKTHKQAIVFPNGKNKSHNYLTVIYTYAKTTNPYPLGDNQLNICKSFNLDVQYPHEIDTSMTIHMQGGTKYLK